MNTKTQSYTFMTKADTDTKISDSNTTEISAKLYAQTDTAITGYVKEYSPLDAAQLADKAEELYLGILESIDVETEGLEYFTSIDLKEIQVSTGASDEQMQAIKDNLLKLVALTSRHKHGKLMQERRSLLGKNRIVVQHPDFTDYGAAFVSTRDSVVFRIGFRQIKRSDVVVGTAIDHDVADNVNM